jgi:hypothetical protein
MLHIRPLPTPQPAPDSGEHDEILDNRRARHVAKLLSNIAGSYETQGGLDAPHARDTVIEGALDWVAAALKTRLDGPARALEIASELFKRMGEPGTPPQAGAR